MSYAEQIAFNRREAADAFRVSLRTVDYLLAGGALRGRCIGRRVVIPRSEIDRLLRGNTAIEHGSASRSTPGRTV